MLRRSRCRIEQEDVNSISRRYNNAVYANFLAVVLFDTAIDGVKVIVGALPPRGDSGARRELRHF